MHHHQQSQQNVLSSEIDATNYAPQLPKDYQLSQQEIGEQPWTAIYNTAPHENAATNNEIIMEDYNDGLE